MAMRHRWRRAAPLAAVLAMTGCASATRQQLDAEVVAALSRSMPELRSETGHTQHYSPAPSTRRHEVLALSGGGPDGAFGVGFLTGLQQTGRLPDFAVITGVSTGALIAPLVFADPKGLAKLKSFYTAPDVARLTKRRSVLRLLSHPGLLSSATLEHSIDSAVDSPLLKAIAREHSSGRRLVIATVNLDSQRLVLWDMGAIASAGTPGSLALFRKVMLAAVSIPVAMDPVSFSLDRSRPAASEIHVDGSLVAPFYFGAELLPAGGCGAERRCGVSIIVHNKLVSEPRTVPWRVTDLAARALETMVKAQLTTQLCQARQVSSMLRADFRVSFIDVPFPAVSAIEFEPDYMQRLYEIGFRRGSSAQPWSMTGAAGDTARPATDDCLRG